MSGECHLRDGTSGSAHVQAGPRRLRRKAHQKIKTHKHFFAETSTDSMSAPSESTRAQADIGTSGVVTRVVLVELHVNTTGTMSSKQLLARVDAVIFPSLMVNYVEDADWQDN